MNHSSLNQHLIVPEIKQDDSVSYTTLKNTMVGAYAQLHGITTPVILKELSMSEDNEDYRERIWELKSQLCPLGPNSGVEVFGQKLQEECHPVYLLGSKRSTVFYAKKNLSDKLKMLYITPEEALAYRAPVNEYPSEYGLHELNGVQVKVISDNQGSMSYDGLGFASSSVFDALGAKELIQIRATCKDFSYGGVVKGLLQRDNSLPDGEIHFTESQVKGNNRAFVDGLVTDLWIGVMRQYNKPSRCSMSWTITDLPDFQPLKKAFEPEAVEKAHKLMDVASDVLLAGDFMGLFESNEDRDERPYSMMQNLIRISAGATNKALPPLASHPWVQRGMLSIVSDRMRHLAVNGPWTLPYLISVGCTHEHGERAILCHEGEIGQTATIFRYPFILAGVTGTIVGRPPLRNTIMVSGDLRSALSLDDDGDALCLSVHPDFCSYTDMARGRIEQNLDKQKTKRASSWYETLDVMAEQACSSGGIGTTTYATIASAIQEDYKTANECARHLQSACDSRKHNVKPDLKYCKEVYERFSFPAWLSVGKNEKAQFQTKCDSFPGSSLWEAIRSVWLSRKDDIEDKALSLRSYANIFGFDHGLTKEEYRHCVTLHRYWSARTAKLAELKEDTSRKEGFSKLVDEMKLATVRLGKKHAIASWEIAHQSQNPNATASYVFSVWSDQILELLVDTYEAKEVVRLEVVDEKLNLTKEQYMALQSGLRGKLVANGASLSIQNSPEHEGKRGAPKTTPTDQNFKTVALVDLKDITSDQLAEAVRNGRAVAKIDHKRPLPAQGNGAFGVSIWYEDKEVGQVADHDVPVFHEVGGLIGEAIVYGRSLKLVSFQG